MSFKQSLTSLGAIHLNQYVNHQEDNKIIQSLKLMAKDRVPLDVALASLTAEENVLDAPRRITIEEAREISKRVTKLDIYDFYQIYMAKGLRDDIAIARKGFRSGDRSVGKHWEEAMVMNPIIFNNSEINDEMETKKKLSREETDRYRNEQIDAFNRNCEGYIVIDKEDIAQLDEIL